MAHYRSQEGAVWVAMSGRFAATEGISSVIQPLGEEILAPSLARGPRLSRPLRRPQGAQEGVGQTCFFWGATTLRRSRGKRLAEASFPCAGKAPRRSLHPAQKAWAYAAFGRHRNGGTGFFLHHAGGDANLIGMSRFSEPPNSPAKRPALSTRVLAASGCQDTHVSVNLYGAPLAMPQHVSVHGRDEIVAGATEEFRRLQGAQTGKVLVDALQASPHHDIDLVLACAETAPVRGVRL